MSTALSGIGKAWIPIGETIEPDSHYNCKCVKDGKIQMWYAKTPNELNRDHCAGEYCPCSGMKKKWIYRHYSTKNVSSFEKRAKTESISIWRQIRGIANKDGLFTLESIEQAECVAHCVDTPLNIWLEYLIKEGVCAWHQKDKAFKLFPEFR